MSCAVGMKYANNMSTYIITVIGIIGSFYFLIKATKDLMIGPAYAIFVGSGSLGTIIIDIFVFNAFNADFSFIKIIFILLLVTRIIGLTITSHKGCNS